MRVSIDARTYRLKLFVLPTCFLPLIASRFDLLGSPLSHYRKGAKHSMKDADPWLPDFDDPDDLTPEERLARIVHILALGAIRLAEDEKNKLSRVQTKNPKGVLKTSIDSPKNESYARTI